MNILELNLQVSQRPNDRHWSLCVYIMQTAAQHFSRYYIFDLKTCETDLVQKPVWVLARDVNDYA